MPDHIDIVRGDTPIIRVGPVRRRDATGALQPVNLAGATGKLTAKQALADTDAQAVFQKTGTVTTLVTTNDGMNFALAAADTNGLAVGGELLWDVQITESGGTVTTFPKHGPGTFRIVGDVTLT